MRQAARLHTLRHVAEKVADQNKKPTLGLNFSFYERAGTACVQNVFSGRLFCAGIPSIRAGEGELSLWPDLQQAASSPVSWRLPREFHTIPGTLSAP